MGVAGSRRRFVLQSGARGSDPPTVDSARGSALELSTFSLIFDLKARARGSETSAFFGACACKIIQG